MTLSQAWTTCDLKISAFLLYRGFEVKSWKRQGERVFFEFEPSEEQEQAVRDFVNKKTTVEPLSFMDSMSRARDLVTLAKKS